VEASECNGYSHDTVTTVWNVSRQKRRRRLHNLAFAQSREGRYIHLGSGGDGCQAGGIAAAYRRLPQRALSLFVVTFAWWTANSISLEPIVVGLTGKFTIWQFGVLLLI